MTLTKGTVSDENENGKNRSNEELLAIVSKLQRDLAEVKKEKLPPQGPLSTDDLIKLVKAIKEDDKDIDFDKGIREKDIPKEDFDEHGVVFSAPSAGYVITDDRRQGHIVRLPYNKPFIFFDYQGTRRHHQGKYVTTASFCTYKSHSKKEQEWLRNHSLFGVLFYENANDAVSFDMNKATRLARIMNSLKDFELPALVRRCKEYNVSISDDIPQMRVALAIKMVEKELESEKGISSSGGMEGAIKAKTLLESK